MVTGTTGEPTSVTVQERVELFRHAVTTAAGRVSVLAATGSANHAETVRLSDHPAARHIHRELFDLNRAIFLETNPVPLKTMLAAWGLIGEETRLPLPASPETRG